MELTTLERLMIITALEYYRIALTEMAQGPDAEFAAFAAHELLLVEALKEKVKQESE